MWTRPGSDPGDFIKPSYVPQPNRAPEYAPRRDSDPEYRPMGVPKEFVAPDQPERQGEMMPEAPPLPARPRDPLPAGRPKERPGKEDGTEPTREKPDTEKGGEAAPGKGK